MLNKLKDNWAHETISFATWCEILKGLFRLYLCQRKHDLIGYSTFKHCWLNFYIWPLEYKFWNEKPWEKNAKQTKK